MEANKNNQRPDSSNSDDINVSRVNPYSDVSREIDEIVSAKPPFVVLWGTAFFLVLLVIIGLICWFIRYPEIVTASARLNSINAPKQVIAKIDGKLVKIAVHENQDVVTGQILGYMESIADPQLVVQLNRRVDSILTFMDSVDKIIKLFPKNDPLAGQNKTLGELQGAYQIFFQSFITFKDFIGNGFYNRKKNMLLADMQNIRRLHDALMTQKQLLQEDIVLSDQNFKVNEILAEQKVISPLDYRNEKSKMIARQMTLPQINASIITNDVVRNEKLKEIAELENQAAVQKSAFSQALQTIKSQVKAWETKYLLAAPVAGTVVFNNFFGENQEMKAGELLFYVLPGNIKYFVEMSIPQYNFGRVKKGQAVLLKFDAYPYEQHGMVTGKIDYINNSPGDSGYLARVALPVGLVTNYKTSLQYRHGLSARAEIITNDMRLLQRFYYNTVKHFRRQ